MIQISRNIKFLQGISNQIARQNTQFLLANINRFNFSAVQDDDAPKNVNSSKTPQQQNQRKYQENPRKQQNPQLDLQSEESKKSSDYQNRSTAIYFNLKEPIPQFDGDRVQLSQWFYNRKNFTNNQNKQDIAELRKNILKDLEQMNEESADINQAMNIYVKIYVLLKAIDPKFLSQRFDFIKQKIKNSETDEEALFYLVMESLKYLRNISINKQANLPLFPLLRLSLHLCYKFNFLKTLQECNQIQQLSFMIEDMVYFVYDFHVNKYLKKINHERLHDMYDKVITLCHKIHYEPSYQFSQIFYFQRFQFKIENIITYLIYKIRLTNLSMLSDIKQLNKQSFQKIKIHNTIYYRLCLQEINRCIKNVTDSQLVYISYKLSTIDYSSFGFKIEHIWDYVEERLYKNLDQFNLIMKKSLLYSLGKTIKVTQTSVNLYKQLFDLKQLNKLRYQNNFLEYLSNLILSGTSRSIITKEQVQKTIPFIKELMEDESLDKKEKIDFIGNICLLLYRLGIYDKQFWDCFLKYEEYYLNDRTKFFQIFFISRTIQAFVDEIDNKELLQRMEVLHQSIKKLPYYEQEVARISAQITQSKQSLFEQRFDFFAKAFGKRIQREKIIDDLFSADLYMETEKIAIEIEGHNHYIQLIDGSYQMNLITQFKSRYLQKLGISVIHLGVHDCIEKNNQMISILRVFLNKYNLIKKHQEDNKDAAFIV